MHDQTAMCTEGIAEQFRLCPRVKAEAGEGYWGLASEFPDQVSAPLSAALALLAACQRSGLAGIRAVRWENVDVRLMLI